MKKGQVLRRKEYSKKNLYILLTTDYSLLHSYIVHAPDVFGKTTEFKE
jgi:hypothetical protein